MRSIFALIFYIFLGFQCITATDVRKHIPPGESRVGVELDQMLAAAKPGVQRENTPDTSSNKATLIFMAHHKVSSPVSDLQLIKIAMDGFMDMLRNGELYQIGKKVLPGVLTAFYFDNQIILASSQKGGSALTYRKDKDKGLMDLVKDCVAPHDKSNQAKCGEMSALQIFRHLYPTKPIRPENIVTVTVRCGTDEVRNSDVYQCKEEDLEVYPPCNPDQGGGCELLIGPNKLIERHIPPTAWTNNGNAAVTYSKSGWDTTPLDVLSLAAPAQ
ncbi:hypothetical protein P171DRAFT_518989 [Karstenula rhodostoma CBS 690.94]|uniref:Uncharacterized protein n=1 Tax=Karstenula rhodostoma CBS 690.94 TaxID=1392251 RepID=A0A9P4UFY6_9PLEO|nr:hypothetical protein P171DRAFT_518989 [Karstenula rhodostoma CBS 690.94]